MKKRFPASEYHVPFFDENGYVRKLCPKCKEYYWTQDPKRKTCGESTAEGCAPYTFINNPPTKKAYSLSEMREQFLSFFEKKRHKRIKPYPVVSRWRDDLYFTSASIVDFQPYVTDGLVLPPANPLVISQPCIRFVDVDNVGPTFGRHLTIFEMGGHHAFNFPDKEVYWKDETVRLHHEFVTKALGIPSEEVIYKEDVWSGGGNAGPDLETIVRGLELATLVFMKFKVVDGEFVELPIRTVDTGYGIERYTWVSQGALSGFHAVYGKVLNEIMEMAGIKAVDEELLARVAAFSGRMNSEKVTNKATAWAEVARCINVKPKELGEIMAPLENAFAVADHTKCLAFMLAESVVPSNVEEGYLARLMIRRTYRLLKALGIEDKLSEIVDLQIKTYSKDFPHLREMRDEIQTMLSVEREKYLQTLERGRLLVKRITQELKAKKAAKVPSETLVELYDSHGLPPEVVRETATEDGVAVEVPDNFYAMIAARHLSAEPKEKGGLAKKLESSVADLPETVMLYYRNPYQTRFEAEVLRVLGDRYVVLDKTIFYPEGGGQPADSGVLEFGDKKCRVVDVQKVGKAIVHVVDGDVPKQGVRVKGAIDWERRYSLMKAHTATHLIMGAARRVLGEHVWQAGTQKDMERSRLDIAHFRRLTLEETQRIEELANKALQEHIPVECEWLPRTEAETKYGFRLYQGGAVPGKEIRVVRVGDWEVEACAGTHVRNTGELGYLKILHTERVQDGRERFVYTAGLQAVRASQENERLIAKLAEIINAPVEKLVPTTERLLAEWKNARKEKEQLIKELASGKAGYAEEMKTTVIGKVKFVTREFEPLDVDRMIKTGEELRRREPDAVFFFVGKDERTVRFVVMAGKEAVKNGADAAEIARTVAPVLGGGGSGRPDFAQGGGTKTDKTTEATKIVQETLRKQVEKTT
ncbi:MAG: alanine--tRNA ligase [Candidatus Bathyarchaeia archaeon]|jgi:alanyl-tRNA synthetase|nr:alanine--tRNA ligase [Candidatus Bathyarchaeota archaeon A05DMB-4]MDH7596061.1 alanine--tRNA ligase [Candidatus Bathyarchaeota archaeon]